LAGHLAVCFRDPQGMPVLVELARLGDEVQAIRVPRRLEEPVERVVLELRDAAVRVLHPDEVPVLVVAEVGDRDGRGIGTRLGLGDVEGLAQLIVSSGGCLALGGPYFGAITFWV